MKSVGGAPEQATAAYLGSLLGSLGVGVCSRDRERRIVYINPEAERLLGYRMDAVVGEPCHRVVRHGDRNGACLCARLCPATEPLAGRALSRPFRGLMQTAAGRRLEVASHLSPVRGPVGEVTGFVEAFYPAYDKAGMEEGARPPTAGEPSGGQAALRKIIGRLLAEEANLDGEGRRRLVADIEAAIDRLCPGNPPHQVVSAGGLHLDLARRSVSVGGRPIQLTRTEYDLLAYLASQADRAVSHAELLRQIWGPECESQHEYLHTFIAQLRRKLESDPFHPRYIVTERRYGYRFRREP